MQKRQNIKIMEALGSYTSLYRKIEEKFSTFQNENKTNQMKQYCIKDKILSLYSLILLTGAILISNFVMAQNPTDTVKIDFVVSGVVRDAVSKQPIAAAQIYSFNSEVAATTDENGKFELNLETGSDVLVISAFDHNVKEVAVKGQKDLVIDLSSDKFKPSYIDIEGVAGERKMSFSTEASSQINGVNFLGYASVDDPVQMTLGGNVRSISRSGVTGIGSSFFIRGLNSVNANAQPLFVVDGVIWNSHYDVNSLQDGYFLNSLVNIDLNDIESVTVIKDGTSIYGSKAANGIILINTKRGKDKATSISIKAMGGITSSPDVIPTMNGDQYRIYVTDLLGSIVSGGDLGQYAFLDDDPSKISYKKYHNTTNWNENIYQQSETQNYMISVNGGDDKALYNFSAGYYGSTGVVQTTNFARLNTRFNADIKMTEKVSMGMDIGFTNTDRVLLDDGVNFYTSPRYLSLIKSPFLNPYTYTAAGTMTTDYEDSDIFGIGNPVAIINNALNTSKQYRLNLGIQPVFQINENFSLSTKFDYSLNNVKETYYSPIIGVAIRNIPGYGISENMFRSQVMSNIALYDDTRLTYLNTFNRVHHLKALLGWRYISNYYESDFAEGHNSGTDQKRNLYADEDYKVSTGLNNHVQSISNYLQADYDYLSKYFVTVSAALDGSSRFGKEAQGGINLFGHSWGLFPSINTAWLVSSEEFMSAMPFFDRLKVRASFALTGNDDLDPYASSAYFTSNRYIDRANGIVIGNIGNDMLQWETTSKINFGVDANMLNDILSLNFDVYSNYTSNLLTLKELPEITGNGFYFTNGGELSNTGFEVSINAKLINKKMVKWEASATVGHYKNKIISLPNGDFTTRIYDGEILTSTGNAAGVFYGYKTNGVIATEADAIAADLSIKNANGTTTAFKAGDMLFEDFDGNHIIDQNDRQIIGDPNPDIYGSLTSILCVGDFSLNAFFTYSYGNDVYNYFRSKLEAGSGLENQSTAMLNRWTHEGQQTLQPQATYGDIMGNSRFSDRWIEDGSYLKLKSLSLTYKFQLKNEVIRGLSISVSANNVFTLSNYLGLDPEVSSGNKVLFQGIDTGLVPACKSYLIGIKMNL